jgi:hypothetical protein
MDKAWRVVCAKRFALWTVAAIACTAMAGAMLAAGAAGSRAQDDKKSGDLNAGITIGKQVTAKDVGLPIYPGATAHKDPKDENSDANFGLWGGSFGLKLAVLKLDSGDSPEKVAAFYRKALAKYGPVLDCSNNNGKSADSSQGGDKSSKLTCGDDKPDAGELLFKAGTKEKQHLVSVKPAGTGVNIDLVYLEARGTEQEAK